MLLKMKIVDQHGNPIDMGLLKEPQTANVGFLQREFADHPARGLTPAKLNQILRNAEQGNLIEQSELAKDMEERDIHLSSELSKRKEAGLAFSWNIKPPRDFPSAKERKQCEQTKEIIENIEDFELTQLNVKDGILKAFSCCEYEWLRIGKKVWQPKIHHRPATWFTVSPKDRNTLLLRTNQPSNELEVAAEPLQPFGWLQHVHQSQSGYLGERGLVRVLALPFLFNPSSG